MANFVELSFQLKGEKKKKRLRWPNTVFARALADATQRAHKDCKNKHAVDTAIILFAQCPYIHTYTLFRHGKNISYKIKI